MTDCKALNTNGYCDVLPSRNFGIFCKICESTNYKKCNPKRRNKMNEVYFSGQINRSNRTHVHPSSTKITRETNHIYSYKKITSLSRRQVHRPSLIVYIVYMLCYRVCGLFFHFLSLRKCDGATRYNFHCSIIFKILYIMILLVCVQCASVLHEIPHGPAEPFLLYSYACSVHCAHKT